MNTRKLDHRETMSHLDHLLEKAPADAKASSATFKLRLQALRELLASRDNAEPTLGEIHSSLFPGLSAESRRTTFSTFRSELAKLARELKTDFSLVQPPVRGKSSSQIPLHFEGIPLPGSPALQAVTRSSIAGEDRAIRIDAPAAFFRGETYRRLIELFSDPKTETRLPVRFFLSYAHKDNALASKLLDHLRDHLAISSRFDFRIWQDKGIQVGSDWQRDIRAALAECDLCLSLVSPAFLASDFIRREEIPPVVEKRVAGVPVLLEPVDFKRQNLRGLEGLQIFMLKQNNKDRAFSGCAGAQAKEFARELAARIEDRLSALAHELTHRFLLEYQQGNPERLALVENDARLREILAEGTVDFDPTALDVGAKKAAGGKKSPLKDALNPLLSGCLKQLPPSTIAAYARTGDLQALTRELSEPGDHEASMREHQKIAVDHLRAWVADPESPPFAAVLGEIGSGKTTALRMLARTMASDPDAPPVIFIDLKEYVAPGPPSLEGILEEHLRRHDAKKQITAEMIFSAVRQENALIIFDGLDEKIIALGETERQNFIRELWRILPPDIMDAPVSSGRGRLIISCRSHYFPTVQAQSSGYLANDRSAVRARDYLACIMLPWQDEQIRAYLNQSLGETEAKRALEIIESVHNLKDLASRPYLLDLIGPELDGLEQDRAAGRPVNAASLYRRFIERWLHRDDGKHVFTPAHKLRLMENLAADLWRQNAREMSWRKVEDWLEAFLYHNPIIARAVQDRPIAALHQDFRTATFFLRPATAGEIFRFAHTSLQEYFLACHLAKSLERAVGNPRETAEVWELPSPSLETFDFLGQILESSGTVDRQAALRGISVLLSGSTLPSAARLNALRYHLQAHRKHLPCAEKPDLALAGLDLEGMEFHGREDHPLAFGNVDFSKTSLVRASFEFVRFLPGGKFDRADLRGAKFIGCFLRSASFRDVRADLASLFFRRCDLLQAEVDPETVRHSLFHLCDLPAHLKAPHSATPSLPAARAPHGHSSSITSVAFSPDGTRLLSGSHDNTLRLWDASTGQCLQTLQGHSSSITSVAFSPDGTRLLSGSHDNTLRLWDASTGQCLQTLQGHSNSITSVAFSPDGTRLLSGSFDNTLRLWDATTGQCLRVLEGHSSHITSVAFSPDGTSLLSGSFDNTLRLWDATTGQCLQTLQGHSNWVSSVAFSPDGTRLLSGSRDNTLRLWDATTGQCLQTLQGHSEPITSVAFSPDGTRLLSGSGDKTLRLWDATTGQCLQTLQGHSEPIFSVAFSPDGTRLLSGSLDKTLRLWDTTTGQCLQTLRGHSNGVSSVAFSPDGTRLLSGSWDNTLRLWDATTGLCLRVLEGHSSHITSVAFSPDGTRLLSGSHDKTLRLWDATTGQCLRILEGHSAAISFVAFSPNGMLIGSLGIFQERRCWTMDGKDAPVPEDLDYWMMPFPMVRTFPDDLSVSILQLESVFRFSKNNRILRDLIPLVDGTCLVLEPWNEAEATKPDHAVRMKLLRGPADAWRYCHAVDLETLAILPAEAATENGTWEIVEPPGLWTGRRTG